MLVVSFECSVDIFVLMITDLKGITRPWKYKWEGAMYELRICLRINYYEREKSGLIELNKI